MSDQYPCRLEIRVYAMGPEIESTNEYTLVKFDDAAFFDVALLLCNDNTGSNDPIVEREYLSLQQADEYAQLLSDNHPNADMEWIEYC